MMNKKAQIFLDYLQAKNVTCFQMQEIADDPVNAVIFHSKIEVDGQMLPTLIITDSSIYTMIRVQIAVAALKKENETELIKAINSLNSHYKIFKYYFAEDASLVLDAYVLDKPEQLDVDMINTVLDVLIKHLQQEYKNIMRSIWA